MNPTTHGSPENTWLTLAYVSTNAWLFCLHHCFWNIVLCTLTWNRQPGSCYGGDGEGEVGKHFPFHCRQCLISTSLVTSKTQSPRVTYSEEEESRTAWRQSCIKKGQSFSCVSGAVTTSFWTFSLAYDSLAGEEDRHHCELKKSFNTSLAVCGKVWPSSIFICRHWTQDQHKAARSAQDVSILFLVLLAFHSQTNPPPRLPIFCRKE